MNTDDFALTWPEARHLVQAVEDAFAAADLTASRHDGAKRDNPGE